MMFGNGELEREVEPLVGSGLSYLRQTSPVLLLPRLPTRGECHALNPCLFSDIAGVVFAMARDRRSVNVQTFLKDEDVDEKSPARATRGGNAADQRDMQRMGKQQEMQASDTAKIE